MTLQGLALRVDTGDPSALVCVTIQSRWGFPTNQPSRSTPDLLSAKFFKGSLRLQVDWEVLCGVCCFFVDVKLFLVISSRGLG